MGRSVREQSIEAHRIETAFLFARLPLKKKLHSSKQVPSANWSTGLVRIGRGHSSIKKLELDLDFHEFLVMFFVRWIGKTNSL